MTDTAKNTWINISIVMTGVGKVLTWGGKTYIRVSRTFLVLSGAETKGQS